MKKFLLAGMLALGLFSEAKGQFCPSCIQNSAIPQNAQFNVSSATIRGPLYVGSINLSSFTATSTITAPTFIGSGTYLTGLNASQLTFGTVSTNVVSGNYQGIAGVGVLTAGVWNAAILSSQYGGTGSNLGTAGIGSIPYFSSVGTMSALSPGAATYLLQSNGAAPESWTNAPQVLGTNITAIPMANISVGSIPVTWLVSDVNISSVSAAKVIGNIPGNATNITGNLALTQLSTGTLVNTIVASSITVTGVTPGFWGGPNQLILENVGSDGRIVSISQSTFTVYASSIGPGPLPPSVTIAAAQITSGTLAGNVIASSIAATGVQAGPYGYANQVSSFTVGVDGRLTLAGNIPIAINTNQINNGTLTPGVVVPAVNIQAGSLASNVIASSLAANGVAAGNYGGSNNTVLITVGANGLITSATTYSIPGLSSNTVQSNVDNAWTAPQTFFSSVTVHSTLGANFLTGDGSGVTNISPINIASGTLSANVVASSVSLPYLIVPSSVIASAFFGDGSHLSNLASTVAVTASLYGNGATATPLGVNSSSVAVLSGGFVLNSQLNPANNSIKSFSSLQTISSAYTVLSSVTVDNNILSTGTIQALTFSDGAGTSISAGGVQATLIRTPAGAELFGAMVQDAAGDALNGGLIQDVAGDFLDGGTIQDVFGDKMQGGTVTASTFNATGSAYQMHGKTFMDTGSNLTASSGTFSGTVVGSSSITASAFFGDGSHLTGVIASSAAVSVTASLYGDGTTGVPLGVQSSSVAVLSGGFVLNSQLNPNNNSIKTLSALSLISSAYTATSSATNTSNNGLLVTSSVTAGAFFGDGSHLTGISGATETVNASMTGVGTAANPLGVNSSSVAVLSSGLVLNSQLNPANNSITSLSALTTISNPYTATSSMTNTSSQGILASSSMTASAFFGDGSHLTGIKSSQVTFSTRTITVSATATTSNFYITCNAASGAVTLTLPALAGNPGLTYHFKKIDSSANACTLAAAGVDTVDGAATQILSSQYTSISIFAGGDEWHIF